MKRRDIERIHELLKPENLDLPDRSLVEEISWEPIIDSVGDPALRIVVVLPDGLSEEEYHWIHLKPIRNAISKVLLDSEDYADLFPYVRFLTRTEWEEDKRERSAA